MIARTRRAGNSLAITIPKEEAERHGLQEGDYVDIRLNKVEMRPALPRDVREAFDAVCAEYADGIDYLADK